MWLAGAGAQAAWMLRLLDVVVDVLTQRLRMLTMVRGRNCSLAYVGRKRAVEFCKGLDGPEPHGQQKGAASMCGKTVLVTGATSGIGLYAARALALCGAHVVVACRTVTKAAPLVDAWRSEHEARPQFTGELRVTVMALDLSSMDSIRAFAIELGGRTELQQLDVLICNAGVFNMGGARRETKDGFEMHLGTNCLGHFLLALLLLPNMLKSPHQPRLLFVGSKLYELGSVHWDDLQLQQRYTSLGAYSQSKMVEMLLAFELRRRLAGRVTVVACHPGNCVTEVARSIPRVLQVLYKTIVGPLCLLSAEEGARPVLHAATCEAFTCKGPDVASLRRDFYFHSDGRPWPVVGSVLHDDARRARLWHVATTLVGTTSASLLPE